MHDRLDEILKRWGNEAHAWFYELDEENRRLRDEVQGLKRYLDEALSQTRAVEHLLKDVRATLATGFAETVTGAAHRIVRERDQALATADEFRTRLAELKRSMSVCEELKQVRRERDALANELDSTETTLRALGDLLRKYQED